MLRLRHSSRIQSNKLSWWTYSPRSSRSNLLSWKYTTEIIGRKIRNVELTAHYMHDGSIKTLFDVVRYPGRSVGRAGPSTSGAASEIDNYLGQILHDCWASLH